MRSRRLDSVVRHGVHIVSIDDTRLHFTPVVWNGLNVRDQTIDQIWMPGVHSDVGGGYRYSFFSNISLLLMLDKLSEYCPELALRDDFIEDNVLSAIAKDEIVINDERGNKMSSLFSRRHSRFVENGDDFHTQHPITSLISGKRILVRGAKSQYAPAFALMDQDKPLRETDFKDSSWYARRASDILREKLRRLS